MADHKRGWKLEVGSWKLEVESLFPSALAMSFIRVKLLVKDLRVTPVTLG